MSDTLSTNSKKTEIGTKTTKVVIDYCKAVTEETAQQFEMRAFKAQKDGHENIEANDDILSYYNPEGLGDSDYFHFRGLKVFRPGTIEAFEAAQSKQLHQRMHNQPWKFENQ